jgi:hypothetical protein
MISNKRYPFNIDSVWFTNLSEADAFPGEATGKDLDPFQLKAGFKALAWNDEFYVMEKLVLHRIQLLNLVSLTKLSS